MPYETTSHLISIKTTRPHRDSETANYVVTCSCGHHVTTTDSRVAASQKGQEHTNTPECPECHHRNGHKPRTGCTFESNPSDGDEQLGCLCCFGSTLSFPGSYGRPEQIPVYRSGERLPVTTFTICGKCNHPLEQCRCVDGV